MRARVLERASAVALAICALVNLMKGVQLGVDVAAFPFWSLSYRYGFVRRGLAGTVFRSLTGGLPDESRRAVILQLHVVVVIAVIAILASATVRLLARASMRTRHIVFVASAALFLSQLLPTLTMRVGFFDAYLVLLFLVAAALATSRRWIAAGVVGAIGPFIHDGFVFLWLPILVAAGADVLRGRFDPKERRRVAFVLLPIVAAVSILGAHDSEALGKMIAELPRAQKWPILEFEMPVSTAVTKMSEHFALNKANVLLAIAFHCWPAAVMVACATTIPRSQARMAWLENVLITIAPWTILLFAWDLTRFLVWAHVGAFLAVHRACALDESDGDERTLSPRTVSLGIGAVGLLVLASFGGPFVWSFFSHTYAEYWVGPAWVTRTPAAALSYAFVNAYNRDRHMTSFASRDACKLEVVRAASIDLATCSVRIEKDGSLQTTELALAPGRYVAHVKTAVLDCDAASGDVAFRARWRHAPTVAPTRFDARTTNDVALALDVDVESAAMGQIRVEVRGAEGCFRVVSVDVTSR